MSFVNAPYKNVFIIIIVSSITVFAGVHFVHQPDANHAPEASVAQVNHSFYILFIIIIIIIISIIAVFAGVVFVHQPSANHAPEASVTQVNHSVYTLSTFLRIRADPSMQIF